VDSRRRSLLCLAGASATLPHSLRAQPGNPKKVVWLGDQEQVRQHVRRELKSRGLVEGRDLTLAFQAAPRLRDEEKVEALVRSRPDVIVLHGDGALWPLRKRTRDIPIVFFNMKPDPVDFGLIDSFARPGGNLTGSTLNLTDWAPKLFEMLKQLMPSLKLVAELVDKRNLDAFELGEAEFVARSRTKVQSINARFGIDNVILRISPDHGRDEIESMVKASGAQVLAFDWVPHEAREYAVSAPIPAVCSTFAMAKRGCLIGWSFDWTEGVTYAVQVVQRILRGDSPAIIPVYQVPIAYAVNRRRAREMGLQVPPSVLLGAREVYE
jgi:putative ABC transport system substrate-binding protein